MVSLLPKLGADTTSLTVFGFGEGSTAAMNMHVAFSDEIKGAGLFAGMPYSTYQSISKNYPNVTKSALGNLFTNLGWDQT